MPCEFLAPQSSQNSTDVEAEGGIFAVFSEEEGGSFLTLVPDVEALGVVTRNDGLKTAIELVVKKAFMISEYLDELGAKGAKGRLGFGTRDW